MRPLTEPELELVLHKLSNFLGENVQKLFDREDGKYCLRLHKGRVYYVSELLMKKATNFSRKDIVSFGSCIGKMTHNKDFRLVITCLDYLAPYAKYKVWVKPSAEQKFLYGHHISKAGVSRVSDDMPKNSGVVVYSQNDLPLGFGVAVKSTTDCRHADPLVTIVIHQADIGEYIRDEDALVG